MEGGGYCTFLRGGNLLSIYNSLFIGCISVKHIPNQTKFFLIPETLEFKQQFITGLWFVDCSPDLLQKGKSAPKSHNRATSLVQRNYECRAKFLQSMANTSAVSGSSLLHGQSRSKHSKRSCTDRTARFHSRQVLTVKTLMNQGMNSNVDPNSDLRSLILTTNGF